MFNRFNIIIKISLFSIIIFLIGYFAFDILNKVINFGHHPMIFKILLTSIFAIISCLLVFVMSRVGEKETNGLSKSKLVQIFDLFEDEIIIVDAISLNFVYINQILLNNLGYKKEELLGKNVMTLYAEADSQIEMVQRNITSMLRKEIDSVIYESTRTRKDKTNYRALVKLKYISDANIFISVSHDVTKKQERESHKNYDIRSSLTKISGALKIILSGMVGEVPITMIEMLNLANNSTLKLLEDMNSFMSDEQIK